MEGHMFYMLYHNLTAQCSKYYSSNFLWLSSECMSVSSCQDPVMQILPLFPAPNASKFMLNKYL